MLKRSLIAMAFAALPILGSAHISFFQNGDIVILDGSVIDGTGSPAQEMDLLIRHDKVIALGELGTEFGDEITVIDAKGKVVTPGFIDTHAHGDPVDRPEMQNFLAMGVTTICLGQDGRSEEVGKMAEWMDKVDAAKPGPNVVTFVGHGTVRNEAGVGLSTDPTEEQIAAMQGLVDQAIRLGAYGLTTGLEYQPGTFSQMEELVAVAKPAGARDLAVMSHVRNEDDDQLRDSIMELVEQCKRAGARPHISHVKSVYGKGVERGKEIVSIIKEVRASGVDLTADIYPYTASYTGLGLLFPDYALPPNDYQATVENRRDELFDYLDQRVAKRNGPEATLFGTGENAGKTLAEVAEQQAKPYADVLIEKGPSGGSAAYFIMNEELQSELIVADGVNICSDGSPTMRHPRGFGSFPIIIRKFVNEEGRLTLEEAVHKMSGLPAKTVGLDRVGIGTIAFNHQADILIFDPQKIKDTATYENPYQLAEGFDTIILNGKIARKDGTFADERFGKMIRYKE